MPGSKQDRSAPTKSGVSETSSAPPHSITNTGDKDVTVSPRWSGGSWRGKASAVAELARESISVGSSTNAASSIRKAPTTFSPSQRLSKVLKTPSKSSPSTATPTRVSISSSRPDEEHKELDGNVAQKVEESSSADKQDELPDQHIPEVDLTGPRERPLPAAGWGGWWSRPNTGSQCKEEMISDNASVKTITPGDVGIRNELASSTSAETQEDTSGQMKLNEDTSQDMQEDSSQVDARLARSSWFGLWGTKQGETKEGEGAEPSPKGAAAEPSQSDVTSEDTSSAAIMDTGLQEGTAETAGNSSVGWAFWTRQTNTQPEQQQSGKVSVDSTAVNKSDQANPEVAKVEHETDTSVSKKASEMKKSMPTSVVKEEELKKKSPANKLVDEDTKQVEDLVKDKSSDARKEQKTEDETAPKAIRKRRTNLILPVLRETYKTVETPPSYLSQVVSLFSRSRQAENTKHLAITSMPPKIKKALAIGVHGYFPAPLLQRVLGPPTGTSMRFATGAAAAIGKWAEAHDNACEIEKIALEGEGMIADRVGTLWKLLLNWIEHIRKADFIMIACHSQGVPVAIMLVAKLISFGCLSSTVRVGICAMAGVNLGPFASYNAQSRLFGASANELFEFSRNNSTVSKSYSEAAALILAHHVRVLYIGSIDDQLVPLESAIFTTIQHPCIYRAVFVDGRIHAPDFLTHLVGFALKLRNLGFRDHGLIRELSAPLAGSLYSGEGHSRIYEESAVYDLAVEFALETMTLVSSVKAEQKAYEVMASTTNPYFLPWALRGLLEEEYVKTELGGETKELLTMFDDWKPTSKVLKDVKFRLEAVKSKL